MPGNQTKILLIEDEPDYARLIRDRVAKEAAHAFDVECVTSLEAGINRIDKDKVDVVLLDLMLPDCKGLESFLRIHALAPEIPIVVLTVFDDDAIALEAVRKGAQDYLVKGHITDARLLGRVIRYAIERNRMQSTLRSLALIDDLTGLYNRRGFLNLAGRQIKLAQRSYRGSLLVFVDVDGLKRINDTYGHREGDAALVATAEILKGTFRTSDVITRLGGDEFAILAIEARQDSGRLLEDRIQQQLKEFNARRLHRFALSLSAGITYLDPEHTSSLEELMLKADEALYDSKQKKSAA